MTKLTTKQQEWINKIPQPMWEQLVVMQLDDLFFKVAKSM